MGYYIQISKCQWLEFRGNLVWEKYEFAENQEAAKTHSILLKKSNAYSKTKFFVELHEGQLIWNETDANNKPTYGLENGYWKPLTQKCVDFKKSKLNILFMGTKIFQSYL